MQRGEGFGRGEKARNRHEAEPLGLADHFGIRIRRNDEAASRRRHVADILRSEDRAGSGEQFACGMVLRRRVPDALQRVR